MLNYQNMVEKPHNATKNTEDHSNQSFFIDITVKNKSNQCNNLNINEARSFFEQSGIIGHTKLKDALILNTSKIHIDTDLLNQIRKKSLGFRPQLCGKKNHETIQNNYDDLLINLRKEVCIVNEIVEIEESKIITLHSEIGKIKGSLKQLMMVHNSAYVLDNSLLDLKDKCINMCVFCQKKISLEKK